LVRKKDGGVRWCIDFRKLNAVTKKDAFPLPLISDCLDSLAENKYISTLDMASGYWQIEIHPEDREKTAFVTRFGLFEHRRMSFGLCNAPSTFQRTMNLVLRGLTWKTVLTFLDDILVLGEDFASHFNNLREVLERFHQHNLKLKPKKCILFRTETKFLGKIVTGNSVAVDPESFQVIRNWPRPTCTREVESFLGFVNYHREHIPHLAEKAISLYQLTGKAPFNWTRDHSTAFEELKEILLSAKVLAMPRKEGVFILDTDASQMAVGGQLSQMQEGVCRPIAYASKALTPAQRKYCTTRKELLALITFTRQFRHYLHGRRFLVRTDHNSLAWLMRFKNVEGQLARWLEELAQYDVQILHRKGRMHANADALSRIPDPLLYCDCYSAGTEVSQLPCGGCAYCEKAHSQWSRFEEDVDDVIPLAQKPTGDEGCKVRMVSMGEECNWALALNSMQKGGEQDRDPDLKKIRTWLREGWQPSIEELSAQSPTIKQLWINRSLLILENENLWYLWKGEKENKLWVVPQHLTKTVFKLAHAHPMSGHRGRDVTSRRVKQLFFWSSLNKDIERWVKSCPSCHRNKHLRRKNRAPLQESTTGSPLEKCHFDILGPLPQTSLGNKYILVIVDQFTKWIEAAPLPDQTAETVARATVDFLISRMGCPLEIFTDQGTNFTSQVFSQLCSVLEIAKTRTTPYHPSANGQVERMNTIILQMIRCTTNNDQTSWDTQLQMLMSAIRSSVNRSTGFTPNFMMLGRETMHPLGLMLGNFCQPMTVNDYVEKVRKDMIQSHELARHSLQAQQHRQKKDYDVRVQVQTYGVGDAVLLANSARKVGLCPKLAPLWQGPFVVTAVLSPVLYRIAAPRRQWVVHHDRLRRCQEEPLPLWLRRKRHQLMGTSVTLSPNEPIDTDATLDILPEKPRYCVCRGYDDGSFMIACDSCYDWFHGKCVGVTESDADTFEYYRCPRCKQRGYPA